MQLLKRFKMSSEEEKKWLMKLHTRKRIEQTSKLNCQMREPVEVGYSVKRHFWTTQCSKIMKFDNTLMISLLYGKNIGFLQ